MAGAILGPTGFQLVENSNAVSPAAELGVLILLFLAGMKLSIESFLRVLRPISIAVAIQIAGAIAVSYWLDSVLDWDWRARLLFGFIVAMSSAAVALNILYEIKESHTRVGQLTIGLMVAQDIAVVPMLIILEGFCTPQIDVVGIGVRIAVALALLAAVNAVFQRSGSLSILFAVRLEGRDNLSALVALAGCFGAAGPGGTLDLSPPPTALSLRG